MGRGKDAYKQLSTPLNAQVPGVNQGIRTGKVSTLTSEWSRGTVVASGPEFVYVRQKSDLLSSAIHRVSWDRLPGVTICIKWILAGYLVPDGQSGPAFNA